MTSNRGLRALAVIAGAALIAWQTFIALQVIPRIQHRAAVRQAFAVQQLRPVIASFEPDGDRLFQGDRIISLNGKPVQNRADIEKGLQQGRLLGSLPIQVEHRSGTHQVEDTTAYFDPMPVAANAAVTWIVRPASWIGFIVWPLVCAILAAAVLVLNGGSGRAWIVAGALVGAAGVSQMAVEPYAWDGAARVAGLLYQSLLPPLAGFCFLWIAVNWPKPLGGTVVALAIRWICGVAMSLGALARIWSYVGPLVSYRLTEPAWWLERPIGILLLVPILAAGGMAARFVQRAQGLTAHEAAIHRTLRWGMLVSGGSLAIYYMVIAGMMRSLLGDMWLERFGWLSYSFTLAWPVSVALVGARKGDRTDGSIPAMPLREGMSWNELLDAVSAHIPPLWNLRPMALYGEVGLEFAVRASVPGVLTWSPLALAADPPASNLLVWEPLESGAGRAGYLVLGRVSIENELSGPERRTLSLFAQQLSPYLPGPPQT